MLMAADTIARVLSFALVLYVSRALGPEFLGQLAFAQAMVTYFGVFADLGLTSLAIREIAQRPADSSRIAISATAAQFSFAIVLQAILGGLVITLPVSGATRLLTFVYGLTMVAQALSLVYVLQAHEHMGAVAALRILVQAGSVALGIAALVATRQLLLVPVVAVLVTLYSDGLAAFMLGRRRHLAWRRPDFGLARSLVRQGVVFVVTGITVQVLYNFGSLVIGVERHERELGIYSAAWKVTLIMLGVGAILMTAVFPNLSRLASTPQGFESFFHKMAAVVGYLSLPMAVGAIVLAPDLVALLYGPTYTRSAIVPPDPRHRPGAGAVQHAGGPFAGRDRPPAGPDVGGPERGRLERGACPAADPALWHQRNRHGAAAAEVVAFGLFTSWGAATCRRWRCGSLPPTPWWPALSGRSCLPVDSRFTSDPCSRLR